jgi:hypothetical protein
MKSKHNFILKGKEQHDSPSSVDIIRLSIKKIKEKILLLQFIVIDHKLYIRNTM